MRQSIISLVKPSRLKFGETITLAMFTTSELRSLAFSDWFGPE